MNNNKIDIKINSMIIDKIIIVEEIEVVKIIEDVEVIFRTFPRMMRRESRCGESDELVFFYKCDYSECIRLNREWFMSKFF